MTEQVETRNPKLETRDSKLLMTEQKSWLVLNMIPGIGPLRFRSLLRHFGSARRGLDASVEELSAVEGFGQTLASEVARERGEVYLKAEIESLRKVGGSFLTLKDEDYPANLKSIYDPPPVLYLKGKIEKTDRIALAVVGSRRSTSYGRAVTRRLTFGLVEKGFTVVSGMARGIDTAAHRAALDSGGRTIAVLGCGLDVVYPPENKEMMEEIATAGAVITEFPFGTIPDKGNFPRRNRIISGLTLGTLVVEAGERSGALITADYALDQGREVFAVPGRIDSWEARGCHWLIKQGGAKLVERVEDIVEEFSCLLDALEITPLKKDKAQRAAPELAKEEKVVYDLISEQPAHIDSLINRSNLTVPKVTTILLGLEMKGFIQQQRGKMFVRV